MSEWQPIDSAPRDGTYVLLYDDRFLHSVDSYLIARYEHGDWWGRPTKSGISHLWREATHWQHLPAPPQTEDMT